MKFGMNRFRGLEGSRGLIFELRYEAAIFGDGLGAFDKGPLMFF